MPGAPRRAARPAGIQRGDCSVLQRGNRHRGHQGEREGTMHCDEFLPLYVEGER
jgi:hypothetical protein